jgi:hypothetical protein
MYAARPAHYKYHDTSWRKPNPAVRWEVTLAIRDVFVVNIVSIHRS